MIANKTHHDLFYFQNGLAFNNCLPTIRRECCETMHLWFSFCYPDICQILLNENHVNYHKHTYIEDKTNHPEHYPYYHKRLEYNEDRMRLSIRSKKPNSFDGIFRVKA